MRFLRVRAAVWTFCLFVSVCVLSAQQATVIHGVSLRGDQSTKNPPIGKLQRNATVTLVAAKPNAGFYHVQTADGKEGWVGIKYLTVESQAGTQPTPSSPSGSTTTSGSMGCDEGLWTHVYNPQRLIVKQKCLTVTGTIVDATSGKQADGVRHEADGDTHGWLKLDPEFENLLNAGNTSAEGGNLVFEIVCKFSVTQADAKPACQAYQTTIKIPPVGSHVRVVGTYVQDTNHAKWMEIHPVTSIMVIQ
jgi:Bacterial SH3 domain